MDNEISMLAFNKKEKRKGSMGSVALNKIIDLLKNVSALCQVVYIEFWLCKDEQNRHDSQFI